MLPELGAALSQARKAHGRSLEAVATPAKISAAYLHKLEAGKVNDPSPRVLARVAAALEVDYLRLMELAGYLDEPALAAARQRGPEPHPLADQQLSSAEWAEVGVFIRELVARRATPGTT